MTSFGKLIVAIIVLAAGLGLYRHFSTPVPVEPAVLKIGFIGPTFGNAGPVGEPILRSMELAVDELRASGKQLSLVSVEDHCDPQEARVALQKLVEVDRVSFIVGGICNEEAVALADAAERARVVLMIPSVPLASLSSAGSYVFRNTQPDVMGGAQLGEKAGKEMKTIAVISISEDEPRAYHDAFNNAFAAQGGSIVADEAIRAGQVSVKELLASMQKVKPAAEGLFINSRDDASTTAILDALLAMKWKVKLYGYPTVAGKAELPKYKVLLAGMTYAEAPHLDSANPKTDAFVKAFEAKVGGRMSGVDAYNAGGYEAVNIFARLFAGGATTADLMREALVALPPYEGVQGTYRFDANGDMTGVPFLLRTVR